MQKNQQLDDWPLTTVLTVAIMCMVLSVVCGTAVQNLTGRIPTRTVYAERVIYDGPYEKHVELVELTVEGEF